MERRRRNADEPARSFGTALLRLIPHPTLRVVVGVSFFLVPVLLLAASSFGSNGQILGVTLLGVAVSLFLPRSTRRPWSDD